MITCVLPQPSHLPLGILPCVDFDLFYGLFKGALPIEIGEEFLVADRVQSIQMAFGIQGFGFFQETLFHHHVHAFVDAFNELLAVPEYGVFLDVEITLDSIANAERGERLSRLVAHLKGALQTARILLVNDGLIFRIKALNGLLHAMQACIFVKFFNFFPDFGLHIRHGIDAVAYCIDEKARAAGHDDDVVGLKKIIQ